MRLDLVHGVSRHHAVPPAIGKVNHQADEQPDDQPIPVLRRQREHQEQAGENAQNWDQRN